MHAHYKRCFPYPALVLVSNSNLYSVKKGSGSSSLLLMMVSFIILQCLSGAIMRNRVDVRHIIGRRVFK